MTMADNWVQSATINGIGGSTYDIGCTSYHGKHILSSYSTSVVELKLFFVLTSDPATSVELGYLEKVKVDNKPRSANTSHHDYTVTQLAKDELIKEDGTIDHELAKTGIPEWKRNWYND